MLNTETREQHERIQGKEPEAEQHPLGVVTPANAVV